MYLLLAHCVHKVCSAACLLLERVSFRVQFPAVPQWRRSRACYLKFTSRISGRSSLLLSPSLSLTLSAQCAAALNLKRTAVHILVLKQALLERSSRKINSMQIVADSAGKLVLAFND